MARTKIIATLGPATADKAIIERLILLGVNVFRLNFSHGDYDFHAKLIKDARSAAEKLSKPIALLQDISGPKIRVKPMEPYWLVENNLLHLWKKIPPKGAQNETYHWKRSESACGSDQFVSNYRKRQKGY